VSSEEFSKLERIHARIFLLFKIPKWKSKWYGEKRSIFKRLKIDGREKYPKQKILITIYSAFVYQSQK
jgi:hypothetical protein